VETVLVEAHVGQPYRPFAPRSLLRVTVDHIVVEIDDRSVAVRDLAAHAPAFVVTGVDTLFVVDRQPPSWRFFTWYGVFARRRGRADQLIVESSDEQVARFVERAIEERLELDDAPVHGELRAID
jgi:hypothetical protein